MTSEIKAIRKAIRDYAESKPERSYAFGCYIGTVGTKYVEIINCHGTTTTEKIPLEEFGGMVADGYKAHFTECLSEYQESQEY